MNGLSTLLKTEYGIISDIISPASGGFSTKAAYRIKAADNADYFVKVYDKMLPTTCTYVGRIDIYMPVLEWLSNSSSLYGRVLTPIKTLDGAYKTETDADVYVAFLYVNGNVPGIDGMTRGQTIELAGTLALMHEISEVFPLETSMLSEDVSLPFCGHLVRYLREPDTHNYALRSIVYPHSDSLIEATNEIYRLRNTVRLGYTPLVLCHGDAHGNNVIQSERLVLADWEDLRLAPPEADLFIHAWHPYGDLLLEAYSAARPGYRISRELLRFYILRRRIEDIWVDIQRLTCEFPDESETALLYKWIQHGIEEISGIMSRD